MKSKRHGRGQRWRVNYTDPVTGEDRTAHFDKKSGVDSAEEFENKIKAAIAEGRYIDPKAGQQLVADYADTWLSRLQKRTSTRSKYAGIVENHIKPVLGEYKMVQVVSGTIQDWVTDRRTETNDRKPLAASTLRTIYNSVVYPMFKRAVTDRVIPAHPCVDIVLPELPDGEYDLPTIEQVDALARSMDTYYRSTIFLAAGCGPRLGEVFGLELEAVDFLRREVHIRHQLTMANGTPHLAPLKTKSSKRTVELPTVAGNMLARHIELYPPKPVLVWDRTNPDKPRQRKARLLWLDPSGRPMRGSRWSDIWRAGVDAAGLPEDTYTMTSLRHFFATTLIYAGKNVKSVQMAMGHAKPTVTLETYLGYWPDDERDGTRAVVDAAFASLSDEFCTRSVPDDLGKA
ncbi:site-specific integrase [Lentzea sp. NBRC 105346]|uniref:tyrosine-type recombinase/integrase n=1 Tax=Lentzea sp. NBRC 105346 TaxID=3032205 RepID=UPI0025545A94|nr:site-specific integrase [Lentzea sp. NBRC 105346]